MKCYKKDYPRPQFVRDNWQNLNGVWDFGFDDENEGEKECWCGVRLPPVMNIPIMP